MEGETSNFLVAPKMSSKTLKRKARTTTSVKGRRLLKKNSKKQSKRSAKTRRRSISYEYEMKSRMTWEFADEFQNIDNWHESLKGDDGETNPVKIELQLVNISNLLSSLKAEDCDKQQPKEIRVQMKNKELVGEMPVGEFLMENSSFGIDRQNINVCMIDDEPVLAGGCTSTSNDTPMTQRTVQKSSSKKDITRQPGLAADSSEIESNGVFDLLNLLPNNNNTDNTNGVETHTNQKQHMKNSVQATNPKFHNQMNKKQFKCPDCQKEFGYNSKLIVHSRIHSGEKPFKCNECPQMFSVKSHLTRHQHIHSGEKTFKCTECPQLFSQKGDLTTHQRVHSGEKPFKCSDCPMLFSQKSNLTTHQRIHSGEKPFKCIECPQVFSQKGDLTRHQRIHLGEKPFKCAECPQVFSRKSHLTVHQRVHSGEKPFKCTDCPQVFSRKSGLTRHQRIHLREKPFKCAECPQVFSRKSHLTVHQRVHSGEKPFKCT